MTAAVEELAAEGIMVQATKAAMQVTAALGAMAVAEVAADIAIREYDTQAMVATVEHMAAEAVLADAHLLKKILPVKAAMAVYTAVAEAEATAEQSQQEVQEARMAAMAAAGTNQAAVALIQQTFPELNTEALVLRAHTTVMAAAVAEEATAATAEQVISAAAEAAAMAATAEQVIPAAEAAVVMAATVEQATIIPAIVMAAAVVAGVTQAKPGLRTPRVAEADILADTVLAEIPVLPEQPVWQ